MFRLAYVRGIWKTLPLGCLPRFLFWTILTLQKVNNYLENTEGHVTLQRSCSCSSVSWSSVNCSSRYSTKCIGNNANLQPCYASIQIAKHSALHAAFAFALSGESLAFQFTGRGRSSEGCVCSARMKVRRLIEKLCKVIVSSPLALDLRFSIICFLLLRRLGSRFARCIAIVDKSRACGMGLCVADHREKRL